MIDEEDNILYARGKIVAIAQAILDEEIGIIGGSRKISLYSSGLYRIESSFFDEEYFTIFEAVNSETAHLPVDWERKNWSEEALKRKDREIIEYESQVRKDVLAACQVLVERYRFPDGRT